MICEDPFKGGNYSSYSREGSAVDEVTHLQLQQSFSVAPAESVMGIGGAGDPLFGSSAYRPLKS